ncbi:MAG: SOS response-associated peptidase [Acidimicrobiaceae bacterium]
MVSFTNNYMCGRFNSIASGKDFAETYGAEFGGIELQPNHNVAPTSKIYVLTQDESRKVVSTMTWGLVPSWSKDKSRSASMINARSETLAEKPSFRSLLTKHRCVIPIQGFYEWQVLPSETKKPKKQAHYISRSDGQVMTLAGLWTTWKDTDNSLLQSCTIITIEATNKLAEIHHRMPVILERDSIDEWLALNVPMPVNLLRVASDQIVSSEPTSRLDRASRNGSASDTGASQLEDDSIGRLF